MSAVETCDEIEARSHGGHIVDGRVARQFARQKGGDVCLVPLFIYYRRTNHACAHRLRALAEQSHSERARARHAIEASHGFESALAPAFGWVFPGETPNKVELKQLLDSFQDTMNQRPYEAMLRGELPYSALALSPRSLEDISPTADATSGTGAFRAALRAQLEHENKIKEEAREALVCDYSNRIASILATAMLPRAGLKLRKLQHTHGMMIYPSMYDGVQMLEELKDELANLHHAYDSEEHERKIELMKDEILPYNCSGHSGLRR
eukprot:5181822-Pleurochrysis_carterae.AAC.2